MTQRSLKVGIWQMPAGLAPEAAHRSAAEVLSQMASEGASLALLPELFALPYFPQLEDERHFDLAERLEDSETVRWAQGEAKRHNLAIPVSFFERSGPHCYNSVAFVGSDGTVEGLYRKSHIPDGPGYEEKFFFRPGNTGFKAFRLQGVSVGVGICWDQWFPECARALALSGAELLLYPTAIGSEPRLQDAQPQDSQSPDSQSPEAQPAELDTRKPWRRVMVGHAVANAMPVAAANRIGTEGGLTFYGGSFACDPQGELLADLGYDGPGYAVVDIDLDAARRYRDAFGFFRDRRPDLYGSLLEP